MQDNSEKLFMSPRFGEWFDEATKDCMEWQLYAVALISRLNWIVAPYEENSDRYELTTRLHEKYSDLWADVAEEIKQKGKEKVISAILNVSIEIKKEKMYEIPLPELKSARGNKIYVSVYDDACFCVAPKSPNNKIVKQQFTEKELLEWIPEFYRKLAVEVKQ